MVTHQLQVERRTGKVRRPETDVLPLCHATNTWRYMNAICQQSEVQERRSLASQGVQPLLRSKESPDNETQSKLAAHANDRRQKHRFTHDRSRADMKVYDTRPPYRSYWCRLPRRRRGRGSKTHVLQFHVRRFQRPPICLFPAQRAFFVQKW